MSSELHQSLNNHEVSLKIQNSGKELYPTGKVPDVGETLQRTLLAKTLEGICNQGPNYFYTGKVNEAISKALHVRIITSKVSLSCLAEVI